MEIVILHRLERLERSNRRLKAGISICAALLAATLWIGAERSASPVVSAESIRLVDSAGKIRAALGSDKDGTFFFMNDETGKMRMSVAAQSRQTYVDLKDAAGEARVLMVTDEAGPGLKIKDEQGATVGALTTDKQGPLVQLREAGMIRIVTTFSDVVQEERREPPPVQPKP